MPWAPASQRGLWGHVDLRDTGKMLRTGVGKQGWGREQGDVCSTAALHHPLWGSSHQTTLQSGPVTLNLR